LQRSPRRPPPAPRPSLDEPRASGRTSPDLLRLLNRSGELRERRMHEFETSFAVARAGTLLVAERLAPESGRAEGLVLDVSALLDTLGVRLLGAPPQLKLLPLTAAPPAAERHRHRLSPPLDGYQVELGLPPLDDADAGSALRGFAALFSAATVLGLLAIYRMLVVQIAFAERRNDFVSAVTHELRTPLTTIRMYAEMLRDGMVADEATRREYYETITAEGERLTRLINNVMEHGRLRRGQRRAQLQRADPQKLVQEAVELMRPHLAREGFSVELQPAAPTGSWPLDGDALRQILFNVLDNARKYGRGAEAKIEVQCARTAAGELELRVRDHGPGVPEAQLPHLFEPFYRGESELTREHQGTGLGLALVRDLARVMHGRAEARNGSPGLELRVLLPLGAADGPVERG
jgi:signal transduction histidine kinase